MENGIIKCNKEKGKLFVLRETTYSLNIRSTPNPSNKENIIGVLNTNKHPILIHSGDICRRADGSMWIHVTSYDTIGVDTNKRSGWINSHYVRKID